MVQPDAGWARNRTMPARWWYSAAIDGPVGSSRLVSWTILAQLKMRVRRPSPRVIAPRACVHAYPDMHGRARTPPEGHPNKEGASREALGRTGASASVPALPCGSVHRWNPSGSGEADRERGETQRRQRAAYRRAPICLSSSLLLFMKSVVWPSCQTSLSESCSCKYALSLIGETPLAFECGNGLGGGLA